MDFAEAVVNPTMEQTSAGIAAMLVLTATGVGLDRAVTAVRRYRSDVVVAAILPMLHPAALNARLRRSVKRSGLDVGDLRAQTAASIGVDEPATEQLTRVTWKSALKTEFIVFASYTLIGGLADVGFATIVDSLDDANWSLLLLRLPLAAATNYTDAIALAAVSPSRYPSASRRRAAVASLGMGPALATNVPDR